MTLTNSKQYLLFVYNAKSGILNQSADWLLKNFSPKHYSCDLCQLTHHSFGKKTAFKNWLKKVNAQVEFYHKDEWMRHYPSTKANQIFPAIFTLKNGAPQQLISTHELSLLTHLTELQELISLKLQTLSS